MITNEEHAQHEHSVPQEVRLAVLERDHYQCQVCGTTNQLQLHHWVFRSAGGGHDAANLVTVCAADHNRIHARTIEIELHEVLGRVYAFVKRKLYAYTS